MSAAHMIPAPDFYTESEGGKWISWRGGDIPDDLDEVWGLPDNTNPSTTINGIVVFSLCWKIPADTDSSCFCRARWDCINGWTNPLERKDYENSNA